MNPFNFKHVITYVIYCTSQGVITQSPEPQAMTKALDARSNENLGTDSVFTEG